MSARTVTGRPAPRAGRRQQGQRGVGAAPPPGGAPTPFVLPTPEGVPVRLLPARAGDRALAFVLDMLAIAALSALAVLVLVIVADTPGKGFVTAWALLAIFLTRLLWFIGFEHSVRAATPGKRVLSLRVVDRQGGALTSDAIVLRNLTREAEIFVPLTALAAPAAVVGEHSGWLQLLAVLWTLGLALLPMLNRERLRVGDLLAGTVVVHEEPAPLLPDLAEVSTSAEPRHVFTAQQLEQYGIYELQVLEDVLRTRRDDTTVLREVTQRIARRLGLPPEGIGDPGEFLTAFYVEQRAHLERRHALGRARARKHDRPPARAD